MLAAGGENEDEKIGNAWVGHIRSSLEGAGAALETKRLQEIGWLRLDPIALRMAKPGYCIFAEVVRNACFLGHALEILMILMDGPRTKDGRFAMPQTACGPPQRFFRDNSDIFQQPIVQRAQILPSLPAN